MQMNALVLDEVKARNEIISKQIQSYLYIHLITKIYLKEKQKCDLIITGTNLTNWLDQQVKIVCYNHLKSFL